jgi:hypothetical protein
VWVNTDLAQTRKILVGGVDDPFDTRKLGGEVPQITNPQGINQVVCGAGSMDLNQICALGISKTTRPLRIDGEGALRGIQVIERLAKTGSVLDNDNGNLGRGLGERLYFYVLVAHGFERDGGRAATPSGVEGNPASMHTNSDQASMWALTLLSSGLHDARTSTCAPWPSSARSPNPVESTVVVVPAA